MTFIAPTPSHGSPTFPFATLPRPVRSRAIRIGDEASARAALGADGSAPMLAHPGRSLEDLARIALG